MSGADAGLRVDRWLWYARFFRSRTLAAQVCASGHIRINSRPVRKPGHLLRPGDVLTFPAGLHIRVVEVLALAGRRGPAPEARTLYRDLDPPTRENALGRTGDAAPARPRGEGRPTKADRRAFDRLRGER